MNSCRARPRVFLLNSLLKECVKGSDTPSRNTGIYAIRLQILCYDRSGTDDYIRADSCPIQNDRVAPYHYVIHDLNASDSLPETMTALHFLRQMIEDAVDNVMRYKVNVSRDCHIIMKADQFRINRDHS